MWTGQAGWLTVSEGLGPWEGSMGPQAMQILFGEKTRNIYLRILKIFFLLNIVINKSSGFIFVKLEVITSTLIYIHSSLVEECEGG